MAFTWQNIFAAPTGDSTWNLGTFANVDEWPFSDADEIRADQDFTESLDGFDLSSAGGDYKGFKLWLRWRNEQAAQTYTGTIRLLENGTTEIWSSGSVTLPSQTSFNMHIINIPDGAFSGSENLSNLSVEFSFTRDGGSNDRFHVSACRLSKSPFTAAEEATLPTSLAGQDFTCFRADDLADLGAVADEEVVVWPDASGNGRHLVQVESSGTAANLHTNDGKYVDFPDGSGTRLIWALGHDVSGGSLVKKEFTGNHVHHARVYFDTGGAGGSETRTIYSQPNANDLADVDGAPGDKNILGLDDDGSGDQWVIMSGDGSVSAHLHGGAITLDTWYRATQWVQDAGNEHLWVGQDAATTIDAASGSNDLYGFSVGAREDFQAVRNHEGRIAELWFVDGAGITETDIDNARSDPVWTVLTRSIQAGGGGDYTTVSAWESAAPSFGNDIWKGEIDDNSEYNENVAFGNAGTPSSTSYYWLTGGASNRHAGVVGTGHPRIRGSTNGSHVIDVGGVDWTRIEWLEIQQDSTGTSDEGIRLQPNDTNVLISHCIIWTVQTTAQQDGIYLSDSGSGSANAGSVSIDNCIIYGFVRAKIHCQQFEAQAAGTWTINIDHCTLIHNRTAGDGRAGAVFIESANASDNITVNVYNTIGYMEEDIGAGEVFVDGGGAAGRTAPTGTVTWNGSHNLRGDIGTEIEIDGTNNLTNSQFATSGDADTSQSSGSFVVFENIVLGSEDFRLLDDAAGNLAARNGTNRQGSEPDSRQDFSVTVTGETRPTTGVDIGADQFISAFSTTTAFATGDQTIADVVNEADGASPLWSSIDDDPDSPTDSDWVNNAVNV